MNIKKLFLFLIMVLILFFVIVKVSQAIETYSYSATNFQINTGCSGVVGATPSNLTTRGDIVKISGTGFGNRDIDDATPEMVYVSTSDGLLNIYRGLGSIDGVNEVPFGLLSWTDSEITMEVRTGLENTLGNYVILRTYPGTDGNQSDCIQGTLTAVSTTPPVCASFSYSDWGSCSNEQQTRTVFSSSPDGCIGGSPVLTQSCTPQCTISDYSCTDWTACSSSGTQTRTCNKVSICDGGVQMPATSQSCTYTPPVCTSWTYSDWGVCSTSGQQTRSIASSSPNDCTGGSPVLTQTCTPVPSCTADTWTCGEWNACSAEGSQSRTCSITTDCPEVSTPSPATSQSCVYNGPTITSMSPNIIYAGTSVTLNGSKFMNLEKYEYSCYNCKVLINDKEMIGVLSWYNWYDDKVSFKIPSDAQSGYIQVQDSKGNRSNKFSFTISKKIPQITSVSPLSLYTGGIITIEGSDFGACISSSTICGVAINGKLYAVYSQDWSNTKVIFTLPKDAISGYIQIINADGNESNKVNFTVSQDPATIPAVITSISPKVITPGDIITISGNNFGQSQGSSKVMVGGSSAYGKILSWTDTEIKYQTSVSWDSNSRKIGVSKCKNYWTCLPVVYGGYFYIQPQITSLDKLSGVPFDTVVITGRYLKNSNVASDNSTQYFLNVYFNGISALFLKNFVWNPDRLEVVVPPGAISGPVTLEITADTNEKVIATGPKFNVLQPIANDPLSDRQQYLKQIRIPETWASYSVGNGQVVVAVIDDGIYLNHPDLEGNFWKNHKEVEGNGIDDDGNGYIDDYHGYNFLDRNNILDIKHGTHGTMVAGIIGAVGNNNEGIAGVAWNVKLMPLITCDSTVGSSIGCPQQIVIEAMKYAINNGAHVINLSLGTARMTGFSTAYDEVIKEAYSKGVMVIAAAGNGDLEGEFGKNLNETRVSPVCNDYTGDMIIGVGAVDEDNVRLLWSNYGSNCVDIYAPGVGIMSTASPNFTASGDRYAKGDGTSFAAPIVSGVVALLKSAYPSMSNFEIRERVVRNAKQGVIDAYATLSEPYTPPPVMIAVPTHFLQKNGATNQDISPRDTGTETKKIMNPSKIEELLPAVGAARNENDEIKHKQLIESDANVYKVQLSSDQKIAVTNFVTYGISSKTIQIGAGERRALVRDYFETVGRGDVNWLDVENLVNGQKVVSRNLDKERAQVNTVQKMFKKIFGHDPVFSNPTEDLAWNTMMYRIRFPRDLEKEKVGIGKFQAIFKQSPKLPLDWATVRALGYVKK